MRYGKWVQLTPRDIARAEAWFDRREVLAVLVGRCVPLIRSVVSIPAGFRRMNLVRFTLYTAIGAAVWNTVLITAGYLLRDNWDSVEPILSVVQYVVIAAIVGAVGWFVISRRRRIAAPTRDTWCLARSVTSSGDGGQPVTDDADDFGVAALEVVTAAVDPVVGHRARDGGGPAAPARRVSRTGPWCRGRTDTARAGRAGARPAGDRACPAGAADTRSAPDRPPWSAVPARRRRPRPSRRSGRPSNGHRPPLAGCGWRPARRARRPSGSAGRSGARRPALRYGKSARTVSHVGATPASIATSVG